MTLTYIFKKNIWKNVFTFISIYNTSQNYSSLTKFMTPKKTKIYEL